MSNFDAGLPRFKSVNRVAESDARADKLQQVMAEIDDLVGLDEVKEQLEQLIAYARVIAIRRDRELPTGPINLHMVFAGPPGTGKTEVARKVGRMLSAVGLLRQGQCVEADKSRLIGTHVGQTAPLVEAKIKQAMNGVLFIDEAYAIAGIKQGDTKASPGPYEQDAIDTLLKGMEDNRDRLVVIVAGYTNEMRLFLESNTGLKSRFGRWIEFKTYGRDQLLDIFNGMLKRDKYTVTPDAERQLRQEIQRLHDPRDPAFGNARVVRGFYEQVQMAQAKRIAFLPNLESQPNDVFMTFQADDIRTAAEKRQ